VAISGENAKGSSRKKASISGRSLVAIHHGLAEGLILGNRLNHFQRFVHVPHQYAHEVKFRTGFPPDLFPSVASCHSIIALFASISH
jgi:hypothetical protein